jgi:hypothetical protein
LVELASGLLMLLDAYRLTGRLPLEVQVQTSRLRHAVKQVIQEEAARTAAARSAGGRPALAGCPGGNGTAAGAIAPRSPEDPGGGVVRCRGVSGSRLRDGTILTVSGCHVIQRERPQPLPGMSRPATAGLRAGAGRSWPPMVVCRCLGFRPGRHKP